MTDDLVKRLINAPADGLGTENLCIEAADRIEQLAATNEELEAKLAEVEARINEGENKLALAIAELGRLGFDFESIVGRKLEGQTE